MISPLCGHTENCSDPGFFGLPVLHLQLQLTFLHRCLDTTWKSQQQNTFHGILLLSLLTFVSPLTFSTWSSLTGWLKIPASSLTHLFSFPLSHTHIHIYKRTWLTNSLPYNCSVLISHPSPSHLCPGSGLFFMSQTLVIASKPSLFSASWIFRVFLFPMKSHPNSAYSQHFSDFISYSLHTLNF